MCDQTVKSQIDHVLFVHTDMKQQLMRRVERDIRERGYSREMIRYQWKNHVVPAYETYLLPYQQHADLTIENDGDIETAIEELLDYVAIRVGMPVVGDHFL